MTKGKLATQPRACDCDHCYHTATDSRTGEADRRKRKQEEAAEPPLRPPPATREQAEGESKTRVGIDTSGDSIPEDSLGTVSNSFRACYLIRGLKDNRKIHLKMHKPCLILSVTQLSDRRILYSVAIIL